MLDTEPFKRMIVRVPTTEPKTSISWNNAAIVCSLAVLSVSELTYLFFSADLAAVFGRIAFCAICILVLPRFGLREWVLMGVAIALSVGVFSKEDGWAELTNALDRATFFAAFIYLITLMKEAAILSPSVLTLGHYLTNQPPGRRYFATAVGSHFLGAILNFGAVSLLAPLIQRGARADPIITEQDERRVRIREQRQISALLRGFSWVIMWGPATITQAVLLTAVPGVDHLTVLVFGIATSVVMILIGRAEEWFRWRHIIPSRPASVLPFPKRSALNFACFCCILICSTYVVVYALNVSVVYTLMLMAPILVVGWIFVQNFNGHIAETLTTTRSVLINVFTGSARPLAHNSFALGSAGFIGEAAADLAPIEWIAESLNLEQIPAWIFLASIPLIINICGQIALSPLVVVVFLSAVMNELPTLPADPSHIAYAMGAGWALSMTASPNASATLLVSGVCGIPPTTLTWRWNGVYALICFVVLCGVFYVISS